MEHSLLNNLRNHDISWKQIDINKWMEERRRPFLMVKWQLINRWNDGIRESPLGNHDGSTLFREESPVGAKRNGLTFCWGAGCLHIFEVSLHKIHINYKEKNNTFMMEKHGRCFLNQMIKVPLTKKQHRVPLGPHWGWHRSALWCSCQKVRGLMNPNWYCVCWPVCLKNVKVTKN